MSSKSFAAVALVAAALGGCIGGGSTLAGARLADADKARVSETTRAARALAPQAAAEADDELRRAREAQTAGDDVAANLYAERALAAYARVAILARLARATEEEAAAQRALAEAETRLATHATARRDTDQEVADLDKQLRVARELHAPAATKPGDPDREKARLVAAQSLATSAALLCGAARLVSVEAPGLADAQKAVDAVRARLDAGAKSGAPHVIDAASRARAGCLTALTRARRDQAKDAPQTDALLGEVTSALSQAGRDKDVIATRDERGVVVTVRDAFRGDGLTPQSDALLKELARVAAAHPSVAVQVVLHTATAPSAAEKAAGQRRGDALKGALKSAGLGDSRVAVEHAGAHAPVVDPGNAKLRARNARAEIVFVASE